MNDLNGLDWSSKPATGQNRANYPSSSAFSTLKPTPLVSGRVSPLAGAKPQSPPVKSPPLAADSFSKLVAFSGNNSNKNLSLQEQQTLRTESKLQQLVGQKKALQEQWAISEDDWNTLGSGRSTPAVQNGNGTTAPSCSQAEEDNLFAAFNQPVVTSKSARMHSQTLPEDDDDPFGLAEFQEKNSIRTPQTEGLLSDDDVLGDLSRPVSQKPPKTESRRRRPIPEPVAASDHPQDKGVAELVDMGFPADKARRALASTDTGMNVQAAVGLLLNQAHEEARQASRGREPAESTERHDEQTGARRPQPRPADSRQQQRDASQRDRSSTPSNDPAKAAQEFGSAFIKSAGAFWKTAQKQVQQAVSEFNSDSESGSNQPKWMREAVAPPARSDQEIRQARAVEQKQVDVTDEAMMLETERPTPPPRQAPRSRAEHVFDSSADTSRDHSPVMPSRLRESHSPQPAFMRPQDPLESMMRPKPQRAPPSRTMLNKQAAEAQASQAYVSSARRRKPAAAPASAEDDLIEGSSLTHPNASASLPTQPSTKSTLPQTRPKPSTPITPRPTAPQRTVPTISALALKASHIARLAGNESFKRGDYVSAHAAYSTALSHIPPTHTLQLALLANRSLTALKTGEPKQAVADTDAALKLIGPSKGDSETVDMLDGQGTLKPMREYYGKALMRKAEALENLEKWADAAAVWQQCVEDGHGGATAIQGRARAERAAAPKPPSTVRKPAVKPVRAATRSAPPPSVSAKPAAAVNALRASNAAAEKLDDERFRLADVVAARVNGWKGGKEGNLRALLASLDTVLWDGAGWKKISMAELVLPNKVKIQYMKGIGKCHPDKIPTNATTEQRMIAGTVFSTLNEAWDKFKTENNM